MIILQEQLDQPVVRAMAENPLPALELEDIFESDDSNSDSDSDSGNDSEDNERPPCQHQHNQPVAGHLPQYTLIAVPNSELRNLQQSGITYETLLNTLIFFTEWQLTFYWTTVLEEVAQLSPDGTLPNFWATAVQLPPDSSAEAIATRLARNTNEVN